MGGVDAHAGVPAGAGGRVTNRPLIGIPAMLLIAGGLIIEQRGLMVRNRLGLLLADASYAIYLFNLFAIAALKVA